MPEAPATGTYLDQAAADTPADESPSAELWRTTSADVGGTPHKWPHVLIDAVDDDDAPVRLRVDAAGRLRIASGTGGEGNEAPVIVAWHEPAVTVEYATPPTVNVVPAAPDVVRVDGVSTAGSDSGYSAGDVVQGEVILEDVVTAPGPVRIRSLSVWSDAAVLAADTELDLWVYDSAYVVEVGDSNTAWDGREPGKLIGIWRATGSTYGVHVQLDAVYPMVSTDLHVVPVLAGGGSPTFAGGEDWAASVVVERF